MLNYFPLATFNKVKLIDITKNFILKDLAKKNHRSIYFSYLISPEWKSIENLAYDFYGSCDYEWLIMIANNIVNPFTDWLLQDYEIKDLAIAKYGEDHLNDIHHYEKGTTILQREETGAIPVTNLQYEIDANEKKRTVKIIYPELVPEIELAIKNKMKD